MRDFITTNKCFNHKNLRINNYNTPCVVSCLNIHTFERDEEHHGRLIDEDMYNRFATGVLTTTTLAELINRTSNNDLTLNGVINTMLSEKLTETKRIYIMLKVIYHCNMTPTEFKANIIQAFANNLIDWKWINYNSNPEFIHHCEIMMENYLSHGIPDWDTRNKEQNMRVIRHEVRDLLYNLVKELYNLEPDTAIADSFASMYMDKTNPIPSKYFNNITDEMRNRYNQPTAAEKE